MGFTRRAHPSRIWTQPSRGCQPVVPIDLGLRGEGEPGLHADITETEFGIEEVEVEDAQGPAGKDESGPALAAAEFDAPRTSPPARMPRTVTCRGGSARKRNFPSRREPLSGLLRLAQMICVAFRQPGWWSCHTSAQMTPELPIEA